MKRTFRAATGSYLILIGVLSIPAILWVLVMIRSGRPDAEALFLTLALPISFSICLGALRLDISDNEIAYRSLFGGTKKAGHADVLSIGASAFSPISGEAIAVRVKLKNGRAFEVNARPLSRDAVALLLRWMEPNKAIHATCEDARA